MDTCREHNGTYTCQKMKGHAGGHVCHIMGGIACWADQYSALVTKKLSLDGTVAPVTLARSGR